MVIRALISLLIGYLFGLFQTAFFVGRKYKTDLRTVGSGNLGATNVLRNLGKKAGAITFFLDGLKGFLACLLVSIIFKNYPEQVAAMQLYAAFGAVLGHCFPVYLKFKGGKGVSTMVGSMIYINIFIAIVGLIVFWLITLLTRFVSAGSLAMGFTFMTLVSFFSVFEIIWASQVASGNIIVVSMLLYLVIILKHRTNIILIAKNQERRIGNGSGHKVS